MSISLHDIDATLAQTQQLVERFEQNVERWREPIIVWKGRDAVPEEHSSTVQARPARVGDPGVRANRARRKRERQNKRRRR